MLIENELPFTVLSKSNLVLRDLDLFESYDKCRVGQTVITLDEDFRKVLEPNASQTKDRIVTLGILKKNGVNTYCSVEPIMSCKESNPIAIVEELKDHVDLFEFGKWNPKPGLRVPVKYDEGYYVGLFKELFKYCEDENITHCVASHSEEFLKRNKIKYIPPLLVTDRPYPSPRSVV